MSRVNFNGNFLIIGLGSIAKGSIALFLRHITITPDRIKVISSNEDDEGFADIFGFSHEQILITEKNYREVVSANLKEGDFLVNLSVGVSSLALIQLCQEIGALYLDSSIEPWEGGFTDTSLSIVDRSNYMLREMTLALAQKCVGGHTAVVALGANPGIVSGFVKQALVNIAADNGITADPQSREEWARLAKQLDIKVMQVSERDSQTVGTRKPSNAFVNTWSVSAMIDESLQPAELGWGTHEKHWPADAVAHDFGCKASIMLTRHGAEVKVRSWAPIEGSFKGFLFTHHESISIADYFTLKEGDDVIYRPTVLYAYLPSDDAYLSLHELAGNNFRETQRHINIRDDIVDGIDELGVLLMGNSKGAYWYGSQLSIHQARELAPYNNATSLQVISGILAGIIYAIQNPREGLIEPDEVDHKAMLEIAIPYLGDMVGVYTDWTPAANRHKPFPEDIDESDPWQFKNIRV